MLKLALSMLTTGTMDDSMTVPAGSGCPVFGSRTGLPFASSGTGNMT
jgi:hypothetical protein